MKLKNLKEGDLFKLDDNVWDSLHRFLRISYYDDKEQEWVNLPNDNTRSCVFLTDAYSGKNKGAFAWWDGDIEVFTPKFPLTTYKKHLGKRNILSSNGNNHIFHYKLNKINCENPELLNQK